MLRLPAIALALLFLALAPLSAFAETYKTPQALLKALYRFDTATADADAPSVYSAFFSDQLNGRFRLDQEKTQPGDGGTIDFDPVIAGQDGAATHLEITEPVIIDDTAEVEVTFVNFEPVTLFYSLVREHGGWKVDDISQQQGEYPWSLSALFDNAQY